MGSSPQFGGKLLRSFRLSARLTQKDLAEKARISVQTIVRIEEESVLYPHKNTIQQLAYALELSDHERTSLFQAFRLSQKNLMEQLNSGPKAELIGNEVTTSNKQFDYDVALSFAGEDRSHAEALADALRRHRIKVFYDKYEKTTLWGKDLYTHLSDLYQNKACYCVMFFSRYYVAKAWTKLELKAAQARALNENKEYILPIRLDNTEIPGILSTTAYLNWHGETPESVADALLEKLGKVAHVPLISERTIMDWLIDEVQLSNGRIGIDLGDVPGVKHFMRMEKDQEDWEAWYGTWFQQGFTERMGFEPTEESVHYALEKYAELAQ